MSIIKDTFFGGAEKDAARAQQQGLEQAQQLTREFAEQARGDVMRLFPQSQQSLQQGFQGALDVFGQTLPQQAQALTGGNVAAQQTLTQSLPQLQAAILGTGLPQINQQPYQFTPNFSFANQTLPQPGGMQEQQMQQPTMQAPMNNPLAGLAGLGGAGMVTGRPVNPLMARF